MIPKFRFLTAFTAAAAVLTGCGQVSPDPVDTGGSAGVGTGGQLTGGVGGAPGGQNAGGVVGGSGGGAGQTNTTGGSGGLGGGGLGGHGPGGVGGGSGSGGAGGASIPPTFNTLKTVLNGTNPPCVASDCHGFGTGNVLTLGGVSDDQLYTTLTTHRVMNCGNIPIVTPSNPQQSALVMLLKGPCGETPRMPNGCVEDEFGNTCVPDEYIAAIEQWVANGAPR